MDGHKFFVNIMQSSPFSESILKCNDDGDIVIGPNSFGITVGPWLFKESLFCMDSGTMTRGAHWIGIRMQDSPHILFEATDDKEMFVRDGNGVMFSITPSIARYLKHGQITFGTSTPSYFAISYMFQAITTTHKKMFESLVR